MLKAPDPAYPAPALDGEDLAEILRLGRLLGAERVARFLYPEHAAVLARLQTYAATLDHCRLKRLRPACVRGTRARTAWICQLLLDLDRRAYPDAGAVRLLARGGVSVLLRVGLGGPRASARGPACRPPLLAPSRN
jgi:hypothetical protein